MKITLIAGARPNFMKIAPMIRAIENVQKSGKDLQYRLVHTGQHYDDKLSKIFFEQLNIPEAHVNLGAGSGTQAEQTARIMIEFEKDLIANPTDLVIVVGDVTSTMACTIVAKKLNTKVAHVEGGIRSFDMAMPEEINRIVTDSLADYFFTTSEVANQNLKKSGVKPEQIFFVGNTMIDTLLKHLAKAIKPALWEANNLKSKGYAVLTLHRPSNVDDLDKFSDWMKVIDEKAGMPVIFPVHPRTLKNFSKLETKPKNIITCDPLSYLEFIYLLKEAKAVITDSGGVQEETTVLGVPCITLRNNTERPETVTMGTNEMIGDNYDSLSKTLQKLSEGKWKQGAIPELWDGRTSERIISRLLQLG
ncbi:MAG TPA: UDP-N-acetylglucosamine 2-epimerase (non-hydrolyzing) [Cyclobacteriaceae bacterium]|jgi:UDP-N-acetylglucosamine 2-epimerase (non-hydrolysing)|nr:UDP-N-acetylglucosamine 2-epimerase (non-hydrolyzing) [Cyclobacteriaceae bacterium]